MPEFVPGTTIPKPVVPNFGIDGNSLALVGQVKQALKKAGVPAAPINTFTVKAFQGDRDNLLRTCMEYADCESDFGGGKDEDD